MKRLLKSRRGQVAVEQVLLLGVVVTVVLSLSSKIRAYMLGDGAECSRTDRSLRCRMVNSIQGGLSDSFRYFRIAK